MGFEQIRGGFAQNGGFGKMGVLKIEGGSIFLHFWRGERRRFGPWGGLKPRNFPSKEGKFFEFFIRRGGDFLLGLTLLNLGLGQKNGRYRTPKILKNSLRNLNVKFIF